MMTRRFSECSENFEAFFSTFKNMTSIRTNILRSGMEGEAPKGFIEGKVRTNSWVEHTVFHRDAVAVLQSQISSVKESELKTEPAYSPEFTNPLDAKLGTYNFPTVERYITSNPYSSVTWNSRESDGKQSFVGALQLLNNKSRISLTAGAFSF